jgi:hypothetical protein
LALSAPENIDDLEPKQIISLEIRQGVDHPVVTALVELPNDIGSDARW